ncbi:MAG TPA: hypothetical protein PKU78_00995 [Candidatus Dojkabacteria bacterium]|nr:hypothetical protein [Candidatus Dojkabacteria bacterium]HRP37412.1 hypothetical protein [Candidatus Dojkabacteria bacterium]HRP51509.1 hypothetical protein [Candidatus Dojkabacteria bacterium]
MYDTKVQTPVSSKVLTKAKVRAKKAGFSSVNDVIRIILNQFAEGNINFNISVGTSKNDIAFVDDEEQKELSKILNSIKSSKEDVIVGSDTITI